MVLAVGVGPGRGRRSTDAGLGAARGDSVRNLFTGGAATNNCRVYVGQKKETTSPPGSRTT